MGERIQGGSERNAIRWGGKGYCKKKTQPCLKKGSPEKKKADESGTRESTGSGTIRLMTKPPGGGGRPQGERDWASAFCEGGPI